jgi:hypothetical protein
MAASSLNGTAQTNEPPDTALKQQRMKAWNPILDPVYVIASLIIIGVAFVPVGVKLLQISDDVVEMTKTYDSYYENKITSNLDCEIDEANQGKECTIEFTVEKDMEPPILVYYEIENFYQNHREYTTSRDDEQVGTSTMTMNQFIHIFTHLILIKYKKRLCFIFIRIPLKFKMIFRIPKKVTWC